MSIETVTVEQIGKATAALEAMRRESGSVVAKAVFRDKEGRAMFAQIIVAGIPETDEVIQAIEAVEATF
jgi:hypothetical protein